MKNSVLGILALVLSLVDECILFGFNNNKLIVTIHNFFNVKICVSAR